MKGKRPRIQAKTTIVEAENYGEVYQPNGASKNAKYLCLYNEPFHLEIWVDRHYVNRKNFGDENGARTDIDETSVNQLINKSFSHLFYYAFRHAHFTFLNFPPPLIRNKRIVLKDIQPGKDDLNVVVEYHFLELNKYEVTVFTAMRQNNFLLSDNQYCLKFEADTSYLMLYQNKFFKQIDTF